MIIIRSEASAFPTLLPWHIPSPSRCQPGTATTGGGGTGAPAPTGLAGLNAKWVAKGKKFWVRGIPSGLL